MQRVETILLLSFCFLASNILCWIWLVTDVAFCFPPSFYFGIVVPYFWLLYVLQCVDGLCWMWEMSTLGKASGSWSWYCFKNPLLCWWPGKLGSDCKYLSQIDLKVQTRVSIIFFSIWLHLSHTLKEICSLEWCIWLVNFHREPIILRFPLLGLAHLDFMTSHWFYWSSFDIPADIFHLIMLAWPWLPLSIICLLVWNLWLSTLWFMRGM